MAPEVTPFDLEGFKNLANSRVLTPHTRVRVTIYPHANDSVFSDRSTEKIVAGYTAEESPDITVRSLSWQKTLGRAAGQWQLVLKEKPRGLSSMIDGTILPDDWIEIEVMRNGVVFPLCLGLVSTAQRVETTEGGATAATWDLTGVDHGGIAEFPITYRNIYLQSFKQLVTGLFTERVKGKVGGSPGDMFQTLIEATFTAGEQFSSWTLPPSLKDRHSNSASTFLELLGITAEPTRGAYYNEPKLWMQPGETLSQTLNDWCNPTFNEMIWDSDPLGSSVSYPRAIIRERPFVTSQAGINSPWFDLPTIKLPRWAVKDPSVGRSSHERRNIVQLIADVGFGMNANEQLAASPPEWDPSSVKRYGVRALQESTKYIQPTKSGEGAWTAKREEQQVLLRDWHALNPWFLAGTVPAPYMLPEAKIGTRLVLTSGVPSTDETYYVEGVMLRYEAPAGSTGPARGSTTMTVTRGWVGDERSLLSALTRATAEFEKVKP